MTGPGGRHVIIVGGGASGVLLTYQLLHRSSHNLRVTLIEQRPDIGRGLAYHTGNPDHLLNVRVANMSALPDQPDHFWRWLVSQQGGMPICPDPYCFVPRRVYGDYIASLLDRDASDCANGQRLTIVHGRCIDVSGDPDLAVATLDDGRRIAGDTLVLATGHNMRTSSPGHVDPWTPPSTAPIDVNAAVLILGTGLTMVDYVLSLLRDGHRGPIIAISRRGLLAKPHRRVDSVRIAEAEVPFGESIVTLLRWIRARVAQHAAQGGDWRGFIDGLRPYTQRLWHELPLSSKRRFLEHARAWWDVHRHRMAPELESRITAALFSGQLTMMAAKVIKIEPNCGGATVTYRRRGAAETHHLRVGAVVDCTGIVKDPTAAPNPAIRGLFERGRACVDPLRIGIETDPNCAIVDCEGVPSERLFAVGPLTRATFWEIIAIPDIRNQCAELAALLSREETGQFPLRRELANV
ncbi:MULTISPECIES: FAD/NAD(P)-binding protein [Bradyrhizobium]|uniref:FAD-dependent oxidoreductase n=1 Tax=Bradyrhizobium elkanii TaxID=29448 RepID=A0A4U6SB35_BRAEL|nr:MULTISPECIES: FAD/NAD(P)-binding protein [Bradyrhizobium]MTV16237.1 FAD-dependent oxidoreductase [Bradyrhizobium sp. BR2003]TKV81956.1 FAD-dependent oxidoreductase [Bradyrhizobium elkanii]